MSDTAIRRRIRATPSLNDPATMRFILDDPVAPGRSAGFDRADDTTAPLARALFDIDGVQRVHVAEATIHVTLADSAEWADRKAPVAQAIRDALDAGGDPLGPARGRD
uniref:NifU N-terminal domain-containing protein n=1 Tax=Roseovarius halophilus (ex Wu et al. 2025) TaxID=3376060 RepID=UPI003999D8ED